MNKCSEPILRQLHSIQPGGGGRKVYDARKAVALHGLRRRRLSPACSPKGDPCSHFSVHTDTTAFLDCRLQPILRANGRKWAVLDINFAKIPCFVHHLMYKTWTQNRACLQLAVYRLVLVVGTAAHGGPGPAGLTRMARCGGRRPSAGQAATKLAGHARASRCRPLLRSVPPTGRPSSSAPAAETAPPPWKTPPTENSAPHTDQR